MGVREVLGRTRFRLTPNPDDSDEIWLAQCDAAGRAAASERVARALSGFSIGAIASLTDTSTMALLDIESEFLASLDTKHLIDADLASSDLPVPRLRLANGMTPRPDPAERGVIRTSTQVADISAVQPFAGCREMRDGTTIIVNNLVPRVVGPLADFADDLSRITSTGAQMNAYLSERSGVGFGRHWDDHDVLIIQCEGKKYWDIFEPAALSPILSYVDHQAFGAPTFSILLEPGMGLYIPRGWGHEVRGFADSLSVHLTCGLRRMTGIDLLEQLNLSDDRRTESGVAESGAAIAETFARLDLDDAAIEDAFGRWRVRLFSSNRLGPLELWDGMANGFDGWTFTMPAVGGLVFADSEDLAADELGIAGSGITLAITRDWSGALSALLEGRAMNVNQLLEHAPTQTSEACVAFACELGAHGLLHASSPREASV